MRLKDFYEFINERQNIWHRRFVLKQPYPWTQDDILLTFKFWAVKSAGYKQQTNRGKNPDFH